MRRTVSAHVHVVLEPTGGRAVVSAAFRDEVMLYDLWFRQGQVEATLALAVDAAFAGAAHRCRRVQLEPVTPPMLAEEHVDCKLTWRGHSGRGIEFYMEGRLGLSPTGAGHYDGLRLKPRPEWFAEEARRALDMAMAGRDFWALSWDQQAEVAQAVQKHLAAALAPGQKMEPVLARPVIAENRRLEKQHVELMGERFKTRDGFGEAEFDVLLDVQFATIQPLIDFIRHNRDLSLETGDLNAAIGNSIRDVVRDAVASVMSQVELERYFVAWDRRDDAGAGDGVSDSIEAAAREALRGRFQCSHCAVQLRREDRKVRELAQEIMALGPMSVSFMAEPAGMTASVEMIPIRIRFLPWQPDLCKLATTIALRRRPLDRDEIKATLTSGAAEFLTRLAARRIRALEGGMAVPVTSVEDPDQTTLHMQLADYVSAKTVAAHGFPVRVDAVEVGFSQAEATTLDQNSLETEKVQAQVTDERKKFSTCWTGRDWIARSPSRGWRGCTTSNSPTPWTRRRHGVSPTGWRSGWSAPATPPQRSHPPPSARRSRARRRRRGPGRRTRFPRPGRRICEAPWPTGKRKALHGHPPRNPGARGPSGPDSRRFSRGGSVSFGFWCCSPSSSVSPGSSRRLCSPFRAASTGATSSSCSLPLSSTRG